MLRMSRTAHADALLYAPTASGAAARVRSTASPAQSRDFQYAPDRARPRADSPRAPVTDGIG